MATKLPIGGPVFGVTPGVLLPLEKIDFTKKSSDSDSIANMTPFQTGVSSVIGFASKPLGFSTEIVPPIVEEPVKAEPKQDKFMSEADWKITKQAEKGDFSAIYKQQQAEIDASAKKNFMKRFEFAKYETNIIDPETGKVVGKKTLGDMAIESVGTAFGALVTPIVEGARTSFRDTKNAIAEFVAPIGTTTAEEAKKKIDDYYAGILYNQAKAKDAASKDTAEKRLESQKQTNIETVVDSKTEQSVKDINIINEKLVTATEHFGPMAKQATNIFTSYEEYKAKKAEAIRSGDTVSAEDYDKKMKEKELQDLKLKASYVTSRIIQGLTMEEVLDSVRAVWGESYTNEQIISRIDNTIKKEMNTISALEAERNKIAVDYYVRSDKNLIVVTPKSIIDTFASYGVVIPDNERDEIFGPIYDIIQNKIDSREDKLSLHNDRKKINIVNNLVESTFSQLSKVEGDQQATKDAFSEIMTSTEMVSLVNKIVNGKEVDTFFDEAGNMDTVKFVDYIKSTDEWFGYGGLLDALDANTQAAKKWEHVNDATTIVGEKWNQFSAFMYDNSLFKGQEQQYYDYLEAITKYGANNNMTKQLKLQTERRFGSVTNPFLIGLKQEDPLYAQHAFNRTVDGLNTLLDVIQDNPAETMKVVGTSLIPFIGMPGKILKGATIINKINSPMRRTLAKMGTMIGGELIEGGLMNAGFDSLGGMESDVRYFWLDAGIGALRSLSYIRKGIKAADIQTIVGGIMANPVLKEFEHGSPEYMKQFDALISQSPVGAMIQGDGKVGSDFFVGKKFRYADFVESTNAGAIKILNGDFSEPQKYILEVNIKGAVDEGKITEKNINDLYEQASKYYGDSFTTVAEKQIANGVIDKVAVVSKYLADKTQTVEQLGKMGLVRGVETLLKQSGISVELDKEYERLSTLVNKARATASGAELKMLDIVEPAIKDWYSESRMVPVFAVSGRGVEIISSLEAKTKQLNLLLAKLDIPKIAKPVVEYHNLPAEIILNINNPQKIAELISANEKNYQKFGIKTYDMTSYIKKNKDILLTQLGEKKYKRLEGIMQTVSDINGGKIKIYELPERIRNFISGVQGFTTFIKEGDETTMIIGTVGGLIDAVAGGKKFSNAENLKYIQMVLHEFGHNVMLSLKGKVKASLFGYIEKTLGKNFDVSRLKDMISPERIKYLSTATLTKRQVLEEISADLISNSFHDAIFGIKGNVSSIGDAVMKQITQGKIISDISTTKNPFDVIGKKLVTMIESLYQGTSTKRSVEDLEGMMYYIGANILEGNKKIIDAGKGASNFIDGTAFTFKNYGETISSKPFRTQDELTKRFNSFGTEGVDYKKEYSFGDGEVYRGEISKIEKTIDIGNEGLKEQQTFFNYKTQGGAISTLKQGVTKFDIAKIYSQSLVRDMLFDASMSAQDIGAVISLTFGKVGIQNEILKGLDTGGKEYKKFQEALQFAHTKQGLAVSSIIKSWKNGVIDVTKKVDGKNFYELLYNVSAKVTNQGAVTFAGQDMIKFINISDKETYNKLVAGYMNFTKQAYDEKVITNIELLFGRLGIKGDTFGDKYLDFVNNIEKRITESGLELGEKEAQLIAKDVTSRLVVGGPGYLSMLNTFGKDGAISDSEFLDTLAYGLVRKNKNLSDSAQYNDMYREILAGFENKKLSIESADMFAQELGAKDVYLAGMDFKWKRYRKDFFNFLSARTEEFIIQSFKDGTITKINMDANTFANFIDKISVGTSRYEMVLNNKVEKLGISKFLNLIDLGRNKSGIEIIGVYQDAISAAEKEIVAEITQKGFDKLKLDLADMEKNGLSDGDIQFFLDESSRKMVGFSDGVNVDDYFEDILSRDNLLKTWDENKQNAIAGLIDPKNKKKEVLDGLESLEKIDAKTAIKEVTARLKEFGDFVGDIKASGFEGATDIILNNDLYKPFFELKGGKSELKIREIKGVGNWTPSKYTLDFIVKDYEGKKTWISTMIGALTNPATVAESDKAIGKVLVDSLGQMNKKFYLFDGSIKNFLSSINVEGKYISTKAFMEYFNAAVSDHVKGGLTYDMLTKNISDVYHSKYYKEHSYKVKFMPSYDGSALPGYKELVDAYVEVLSKRHKKFGAFRATMEVIEDGKKKTEFLKQSDLTKLFSAIGDADAGILFAKDRKASTEMNKILGLGGNWLGASIEDIAKLTDKSALYHKSMFNNFLYKSFASTDNTYNFLDKAFKLSRKVEKGASSAQYALFYSMFGPGLSAGSQQILSNMVHYLGKQLSEIGAENIDNISELSKVIDTLIPSELSKFDVFEGVPQLESVTGKIGKTQKVVNSILTHTSTLTWADKMLENSVKKYSLLSSLVEHGYSGRGAEEFITNMAKIYDDYSAKGYDKYVTIDRFIKYGNKDTIDRISYLLTKEVADGKMLNEEAQRILSEIKSYNNQLEPLRSIAENARIKNIMFYQMSQFSADMVTNHISGWMGASNMRFLNRASRKAGEYGFKMADALSKRDRKAVMTLGTQIAAEGLYAGKMYMYLNNMSDGGVNGDAFYSSVFLPYVVANMTLLNVPSAISKIVGIDTSAKEQSFWMKALSSVSDIIVGGGEKVKARVLVAPVYRFTQFLKVYNGWLPLSESGEEGNIYSNFASGVPFVGAILHTFMNIIQNRIGRYNTDSSSGIYRNFLSNSNKNYFLNAITNQIITNDIIGEVNQRDAFYDIIKASTVGEGVSLGATFIGFQRDDKMASNAFFNFYKEHGLEQLNGGPFAMDVLNKLETQIDAASIEKTLLDSGDETFSEIKANQEANNLANRVEEGLSKDDSSKLLDHQSKVFGLIVSSALMQSTQGDKSLVFAGQGVTKEEKAQFEADVARVTKEIQDEIHEMEITSPGLIKSAAYDLDKITNTIRSGLGKFGEQQRMGIILRALSNENKQLIKDSYKQKNGKDWYKKNSKSMKFKIDVEKEAAEFDKILLAKSYSTVLLGNQTMAPLLQRLYTNTNPDSPLKDQLTTYSAFGTFVNLSLIEKNVASQGVSSLGINNPVAERVSRMRGSYNGLSPKEREQKLPDVLGRLKDTYDNIDQYVDPMKARNAKIGMAVFNVDHITEIAKDPELLDKATPGIHDWLNRASVSEPIKEDVLKDIIRADIFKEPGTGSRRRASAAGFKNIAQKLNKLSNFKTDFIRYVLKQEPLEHIDYKFDGVGTITPLRKSALEARPPKAEYNFVKIKTPESLKTPDITVQVIKTTKSKYTPKTIKGQNIYTVKTTRGTKK